MMNNNLYLLILRYFRTAAYIFILVACTCFGWNFLPRFKHNEIRVQQTADSLKDIVNSLSTDIGVRNYVYFNNLDKTASYIEKFFSDSGLPIEAWEYKVKGQNYKNILALYKNNDSQDYILIGAHYDSFFNPGADDNASGVAGVLWLAKTLKNIKLKSNFIFVAFTNEEPPFFNTLSSGSRVFIRTARDRNINIRNAVILESIGYYSNRWFSQQYLPLLGPFYPNRGNFIAVVGNFQSGQLVDFIHKDFRKYKYFLSQAIKAPNEIPGINFSDHASFWEAGIPAIMITDTAFLRNSNYHSIHDTINTLDFFSMAAVMEGLKITLVHLSEK